MYSRIARAESDPLTGMKHAHGRLRSVYAKYILFILAGYKHPLDACTELEWDEANAHKNWERHRVTPEEAEDVFFNEPSKRCTPLQAGEKVLRTWADQRWTTPVRSVHYPPFSIPRNHRSRHESREMDAYAKREKETGA